MYLSDNPAVKVRCITNNPLVKESFPESEFHDATISELFLIVRRLTASGHALLTHPLYSNIRPDIGPYKSIVLDMAVNPPDPLSINLMISAIAYTKELCRGHPPILWEETALRDFKEVDLSILGRIISRQ